MTLVPKLFEGHTPPFILASLCVASQFLQLWSQTVNDSVRNKRWQELHTSGYPDNSLQSCVWFGFHFFSPSSMRDALGKMVSAKIGQRRTLINPPKWNNSLPTLLQLWHLDHVILLGFYIFFSFRSFYWLHTYLKNYSIAPAIAWWGIWMALLFLFDAADLEMTTSLPSLYIKGSFGWG